MERPVVVVTDLHAQSEKFKQVVQAYGEDMQYVVNGDSYDRGPDIKGLMDMFADLDVSLLLGNHDWTLRGALSDVVLERREAWQTMYLEGTGKTRPRMESNMLESYGVEEYEDKADTCKALLEKLKTTGHWALLNEAQTYFENTELFVVHAGLSTEISLSRSRARLKSAQSLHRHNKYIVEPEELSSNIYSKNPQSPSELTKPLITGHMHLDLPADERVIRDENGEIRRIFLASPLDQGAPLFAYDSERRAVMTF